MAEKYDERFSEAGRQYSLMCLCEMKFGLQNCSEAAEDTKIYFTNAVDEYQVFSQSLQDNSHSLFIRDMCPRSFENLCSVVFI